MPTTRAMIAQTAQIAMIACLGFAACADPGPLHCDNQKQDFDETDVDCGGSCGACVVRCTTRADCPEGTCVDGTCSMVCDNGVQDPGETDVDCGGDICHPCAGARHCEVARDCASGNCGPASTCSQIAVSFAEPVFYQSGFKPYVLLAGDLDGDGDLDLIAANEEANAVAVFRNTGNHTGVFAKIPAPTRDGFPTGEYPTGGAIADFNRDGIPDVITADYHGNSVTILRGSGTGDTFTFGPPTSFRTVPGAETSNLAVGDLNGDGILDVIATNPQAASASMFIGAGDGTFAAAVNIPTGMPLMSEPYSAAIADFDGNGKTDVAIADNRTGKMLVLLGTGDGSFEVGPQMPAIVGMPSYIVIAYDVDLDGHPDLIVANRSSDDVSVLLGRGDGRFRNAILSSTGPGSGPYSITVGDFNIDGVPDVVTADYTASTASVLLGVGDGSFAAAIPTGFSGMNPYGIAAGDFNGDGKLDVGTANAASNDISIHLNKGE